MIRSQLWPRTSAAEKAEEASPEKLKPPTHPHQNLSAAEEGGPGVHFSETGFGRCVDVGTSRGRRVRKAMGAMVGGTP